MQPLGSASFVVATVYAGGGNAGATYDRDFVVVVNRSAASLSTEGFSLQYASASGTSALGATESSRTPLPAAILPPGGALLVVADGGATSGMALGMGDVVDATPLSLATSGGRLAIVRGVESLGCNGASIPCDATALARVVDLVGWGSASWYETHAAPSLGSTSALVRLGDGCIDADDGLKDFVVDLPVARALVDPPRPCFAEPMDAPDAASVALDASSTMPDAGVDSDLDAAFDAGPELSIDAGRDALADASLDASTTSTVLAVPTIQGIAHRSPLVGTPIAGLEGIVTFVDGRRFTLQSAPDGDGRTSEAIFVQTEGDAPVGPGLRVRVDGLVTEQRPSCGLCSAANDGLSITTVVASGISVLGVAARPAPIELEGRLPIALARSTTPVDLESLAELSPDDSSIDRLESLEGMLVRMDSPVVVGPTDARSDGLREVVVTDAQTARLGPSGRIESSTDGVRLVLLEGSSAPLPFLDVGDAFVGPVEGVVDYERGRYVVRLVAHSGAKRAAAGVSVAPPRLPAGSARIASFNVHGLAGTDPAARFAEIAEAIVHVLDGPDLLAVQEIGDDDGKTNSGTVSAATTLSQLVEAIRVRGGIDYEAVALDPVDGRDGGAPGLNIRPALLIRRDGRFRLVRRASEASTQGSASGSPLRSVDGMPMLATSPMRLGVSDPALEGGRKPLVAELALEGERVFVVVLHLRSQLGDSPLEGRFQPPSRPSDAVRLAEVESVASLVTELRRAGDPPLIVLGDFNESLDRPASRRLLGAGLVDTRSADTAQSTYVYEGLGASLDHILVSSSLAPAVSDGRALQHLASRSLAASDHDPVVATISGLTPRPGRGAGCHADPSASGSTPFTVSLTCALMIAFARRRRLGFTRASRRCP